MDDKQSDDLRYYVSLRRYKNFCAIRDTMIDIGDVNATLDVIFVSLMEKNRKAVLANRSRIPQSHLIGQWRKSELIKLTAGSSEPYDGKMVTVDETAMNDLIDKFRRMQ